MIPAASVSWNSTRRVMEKVGLVMGGGWVLRRSCQKRGRDLRRAKSAGNPGATMACRSYAQTGEAGRPRRAECASSCRGPAGQPGAVVARSSPRQATGEPTGGSQEFAGGWSGPSTGGGPDWASGRLAPEESVGADGELLTRFARRFSRSAGAGPARKPTFVFFGGQTRGRRRRRIGGRPGAGGWPGAGVRGAEASGAEIGIARPTGVERLRCNE